MIQEYIVKQGTYLRLIYLEFSIIQFLAKQTVKNIHASAIPANIGAKPKKRRNHTRVKG